MPNSLAATIALIFICSLHLVDGKRYRAHDHVGIVANTVGPFNNPTETYPFYSLPFCEGTGNLKVLDPSFLNHELNAHTHTHIYII